MIEYFKRRRAKRAALRWVNSLIAPGPKLGELPRQGSGGLISQSCPLARALIQRTGRVVASGPYASHAGVGISDAAPMVTFAHPVLVEEFVRRFDQGEYPELETV